MLEFKKIKKLIKKIKELENTKGQPFNFVNLKKARQEITQKILSMGFTMLEVGNYVLKIGYTNKDLSKPYTQIFTKESFKNYKNYGKSNNTM